MIILVRFYHNLSLITDIMLGLYNQSSTLVFITSYHSESICVIMYITLIVLLFIYKIIIITLKLNLI